MKTLNFKFIAAFFALSLFVIASCNKPDPDAQSAEDEARTGAIFADVFAVGNNEAGGGSGGKADIPSCMDVVRDIENKTVTITFDNCSYRGATRNGIMHVSYSVPNVDQPRAVSVTVTFEDYTYDNILVEGTIVSQFGGTYLRPEINVETDNMLATFPDGKTISWSSDFIFTMIEGFGDGEIENNVIEMSGTSDGINRNGESYDAVYEAVRIERSCDSGYPVSGISTITSDKGTTKINWGDGTCDKEIELTNSRITVKITLN